jgi:hypothetical protein
MAVIDTDLPVCEDDQQRRADVLAHPTLNGIDYVEVDPADHRILRVFFLKPVPPANAANPTDPEDAYGIRVNLNGVTIAGGVRVVGIRPVSATRQPDGHIDLVVTEGGDFSTYTLTIDVPALDPVLARVEFSFMAACPVDFDCRTGHLCPPRTEEDPSLDYLAKDYASFRRMLLDLAPRVNPSFIERNPSDLMVALVELLAYHGDHLSYFQDAVANEAYLETVRQRVSARRHGRLIDYRMHDGRNAWTWIHVAANAAATLPVGTKFVTRLFEPLAGETAPPGLVVPDTKITIAALGTDPALASATVFETAQPGAFDPRHNEIRIHTWGNEICCLEPGTQEVFLYVVPTGGSTAVRPLLQRGDFLLLEEVKGVQNGVPADRDPAHRQVVMIDTDPEQTVDAVYRDTLIGDALQRRTGAQPALPLLRVHWRRQDALRFPLCLSIRVGTMLVRNVSIARGNLVLSDHGLTGIERHDFDPPVPGDEPFRLPLVAGPLTVQCGALEDPPRPRLDLGCDVRQAQPAITATAVFPTGSQPWTSVPDLLDSTPFSRHFVAEIENDGGPLLRFGDGEYGREVAGATRIDVRLRVGNGRAGNVGAEALAHVALPGPAGWIDGIRNPLPAVGGVDPETIEEVRRRAPQAFRAEQFRAVTEADYAAAARKLPEVAGAVATFRWTGSWYTVFVGVDPRDPDDLERRSKGLIQLKPALVSRVRAFLTRVRLAGYDLEIRPPQFVPLEIDIEVCVSPDHSRGDVVKAVADAFSNRLLPDGQRGFFHPDHFTFGQPVYLSRIYAAVERVQGVDSAAVKRFRRFGQRDNGELDRGVLPIGPWEIALLDNDPSFMENGVLRVSALGGKA